MNEAIESEVIDGWERAGSSFTNWFVLSAGAILAVTGIAKVWSGLGNSKFLAVADPISGIKFGQLMLVVGIAEIVIALVCFFSKRQSLALGLVAWISTNFVVYRLGLWWMNWHRPCNCLGNLTDALHISPQTADNIMKVVLAYLLIGSYGLLIWQWRRQRNGGPPAGGVSAEPSRAPAALTHRESSRSGADLERTVAGRRVGLGWLHN